MHKPTHHSAAHELQAWLLHYSPAVLHGILPEDYYQHHLLLVESVYILLMDVVRDDDIKQSSRLLKHYCMLFATYYGMCTCMQLYVIIADVSTFAGDRYMTASLHSLLHLPDSVRNLGPLWSHSCFPFESANGDLLKLFHGSQGIEKQVSETYIMYIYNIYTYMYI